jgi:hypothetical protein
MGRRTMAGPALSCNRDRAGKGQAWRYLVISACYMQPNRAMCDLLTPPVFKPRYEISS